jgi:hypothetical protein
MLDAEAEGKVGVKAWFIALGFEVREKCGFVLGGVGCIDGDKGVVDGSIG